MRNLDMLVNFEPDAEIGLDTRAPEFLLWESMVAERLSRELQSMLRRPFVLDVDSQEKWIRIAVQLEDGVLRVSLPQRRLFSSSGYIFLMWMIGISIVLLAIAILFMRNQIRPIHRLAVAAERFGKGRDVPAFKPQGAAEVRQAAQAFLDMHTRIKRQIEQRTAMLAGVSHDLRTPLTRLKLQLAMLGDSPDVEAMKSDIHDMEHMIGGYLDFVRGEGDEPSSFNSLNAIIDKVIVAAKRQGLEIQAATGEDISIMLRPMAFERCLLNVINNAGKYAKHIWVSAGVINGQVEIVVDDDGPGIPEDQYEEVFRPFYRVDSSRNAATGGVGLGLPIAMDIVHAHGGQIWLEKSPQGGLRVVITIPI
jgi:two-component system osmolarity sensor histidine kinase EnvZ